jgi:Uma2 family endonuclease
LFLKGELYSKAGIKEYWIVDPKKRKIILYNYESDTEVMIFNEGDVLKSLLFSDLEVDTTDLFILPWTEKN